MSKSLRPAVFFCASLLTQLASAQSGAVIPQGGAGHANEASCIILKRMGPADQVTSRLYSFGIRGKQFQYVEGKLPSGFPFHGRLTDHDVRNLQGRGAEVIVLNQNYTSEELSQARADCRGETGKTPNQAEALAAPSQPQTTAANTQAPANVPDHVAADAPVRPHDAVASASAQLQISSTPDAADIEIDGSFVGNTPSTIGVAAGAHQISVKKSGFKPWERKITVSSGQVNVNAMLEPDVK